MRCCCHSLSNYHIVFYADSVFDDSCLKAKIKPTKHICRDDLSVVHRANGLIKSMKRPDEVYSLVCWSYNSGDVVVYGVSGQPLYINMNIDGLWKNFIRVEVLS